MPRDVLFAKADTILPGIELNTMLAQRAGDFHVLALVAHLVRFNLIRFEL